MAGRGGAERDGELSGSADGGHGRHVSALMEAVQLSLCAPASLIILFASASPLGKAKSNGGWRLDQREMYPS